MERILIPAARVHALKEAIAIIEKRLECKIRRMESRQQLGVQEHVPVQDNGIGKQAVSQEPEIIEELKLGIMECARKLQVHINKQKRLINLGRRSAYFRKRRNPTREQE